MVPYQREAQSSTQNTKESSATSEGTSPEQLIATAEPLATVRLSFELGLAQNAF
jgi:hypothetical protein